MLRVFHREGAGRPLRILWTLEEAGEPYELVKMDREEAYGEEHKARHPLSRVPAIETDEGVVFESAATCMYVGDLHPDSGLMPPPGSYARGLVYQWTVFAPAEIEPVLFQTGKFGREGDTERAAEARAKFDGAAAAVQAALNGGEYLVGDRLTVADVLVGTALLFTVRAGFFEELPAPLQAYVGGLRERPAFQRALQLTFG